MDKHKIAKDAAKQFMRVEALAQKLIREIPKLDDTFNCGCNAEMIGQQDHLRFRAEVLVAQGLAAQALAKVVDLHIQCTQIAKGHEIDVEPPAKLGDLQDGVIPLGGNR